MTKSNPKNKVGERKVQKLLGELFIKWWHENQMEEKINDAVWGETLVINKKTGEVFTQSHPLPTHKRGKVKK